MALIDGEQPADVSSSASSFMNINSNEFKPTAASAATDEQSDAAADQKP